MFDFFGLIYVSFYSKGRFYPFSLIFKKKKVGLFFEYYYFSRRDRFKIYLEELGGLGRSTINLSLDRKFKDLKRLGGRPKLLRKVSVYRRRKVGGLLCELAFRRRCIRKASILDRFSAPTGGWCDPSYLLPKFESRRGSRFLSSIEPMFFSRPRELSLDGFIRFSSGLKGSMVVPRDRFSLVDIPNVLGMNGWLGYKPVLSRFHYGWGRVFSGAGENLVGGVSSRKLVGDSFKLSRLNLYMFSDGVALPDNFQFNLVSSLKFFRNRYFFSHLRLQYFALLDCSSRVISLSFSPFCLSLQRVFNGSGFSGRTIFDIFIPRRSVLPFPWTGGFPYAFKFRVPLALWRSVFVFMRYLEYFLGRLNFVCSNGFWFFKILVGGRKKEFVPHFFKILAKIFIYVKQKLINFSKLFSADQWFFVLNRYYVLLNFYWSRFYRTYYSFFRSRMSFRLSGFWNGLFGSSVGGGILTGFFSGLVGSSARTPVVLSSDCSIFFRTPRSVVFLMGYGNMGDPVFGVSFFNRAFQIVPISRETAECYVETYSKFFNIFFSIYYGLLSDRRFRNRLIRSPFPLLVHRVFPGFSRMPLRFFRRFWLSSVRSNGGTYYSLFFGLIDWVFTILRGKGNFSMRFRDYYVRFYRLRSLEEAKMEGLSLEKVVHMIERIFEFDCEIDLPVSAGLSGSRNLLTADNSNQFYNFFVERYLGLRNLPGYGRYLKVFSKFDLSEYKPAFVFSRRIGRFELNVNPTEFVLRKGRRSIGKFARTFFWIDRLRFSYGYHKVIRDNFNSIFLSPDRKLLAIIDRLKRANGGKLQPFHYLDYALLYRRLPGYRKVRLRVKDFKVRAHIPPVRYRKKFYTIWKELVSGERFAASAVFWRMFLRSLFSSLPSGYFKRLNKKFLKIGRIRRARRLMAVAPNYNYYRRTPIMRFTSNRIFGDKLFSRINFFGRADRRLRFRRGWRKRLFRRHGMFGSIKVVKVSKDDFYFVVGREKQLIPMRKVGYRPKFFAHIGGRHVIRGRREVRRKSVGVERSYRGAKKGAWYGDGGGKKEKHSNSSSKLLWNGRKSRRYHHDDHGQRSNKKYGSSGSVFTSDGLRKRRRYRVKTHYCRGTFNELIKQ